MIPENPIIPKVVHMETHRTGFSFAARVVHMETISNFHTIHVTGSLLKGELKRSIHLTKVN